MQQAFVLSGQCMDVKCPWCAACTRVAVRASRAGPEWAIVIITNNDDKKNNGICKY